MLPLLPTLSVEERHNKRTLVVNENHHRHNNNNNNNNRLVTSHVVNQLNHNNHHAGGYIKSHNLNTGSSNIVNSHHTTHHHQTYTPSIATTSLATVPVVNHASVSTHNVAPAHLSCASVHSVPTTVTHNHHGHHHGNYNNGCGCGQRQQSHNCCSCSCNHNVQVHQCCHCHCQPQQQQQQQVVQYVPQPVVQERIVHVAAPPRPVTPPPRVVTPPPPPRPRPVTPPPPPPKKVEKVVTKVVEHIKPKIHVQRVDDDSVKLALTVVRNNNEVDRNKLQHLNVELSEYLKNVKVLENINADLFLKVKEAYALSRPQEMDKSGLDAQLAELRLHLQNESFDAVRHLLLSEKFQGISSQFDQRCHFFLAEDEYQRNKILALENYLLEIQGQREYLKGAHVTVGEQIEYEKSITLKTEAELEALRAKLVDSRLGIKKAEFECQTLHDQLRFLKAVFQEEFNLFRQHLHISVTDGTVPDFYRNELNAAVTQIRQDFMNLHNEQMAEYKKAKEAELARMTKKWETRCVRVELTSDSSHEFDSVRAANQRELQTLHTENQELTQKLSVLEGRLAEWRSRFMPEIETRQVEIDNLKITNDMYARELDHWERVTREKLESEIVTYRSILRTQMKYLNNEVLKIDTTTRFVEPPPKVVEEVKYVEREPIKYTYEAPKITYVEPEPIKYTYEAPKITYVEPEPIKYTYEAPKITTSYIEPEPVKYTYETSKYVTPSYVSRDIEVPKYLSSSYKYEAPKSYVAPASYTYETPKYLSTSYNYDTTTAPAHNFTSSYFEAPSSYKSSVHYETPVATTREVVVSKPKVDIITKHKSETSGKYEFTDDDLRRAFNKFDSNNSGYLSTTELQKALAKVGQFYSASQISDLINKVSRRNDGTITFEEFRDLMKLPTHGLSTRSSGNRAKSVEYTYNTPTEVTVTKTRSRSSDPNNKGSLISRIKSKLSK